MAIQVNLPTNLLTIKIVYKMWSQITDNRAMALET